MRNNLKKMAVLGMAVCMTLGMAGCGRAGKAELADELNRASDDNGSGSDEGTAGVNNNFGGEDDVKLEYTLVDEEGVNKVTVDAVMDTSNTERASIYGETLLDVSDTAIDELGKRLFDGGEYETVKPYFFCNTAELEMYEAQLAGEIRTYADSEVPGTLEKDLETVQRLIQWPQDLYNYIEAEEGRILYEDDTYGTVQGRLRGTIGDETWTLDVWTYEGTMGADYTLYPYNRTIGDVSLVAMDEESAGEDLQATREVADAFLADIGYENLDVILTYELRQTENLEEKEGYYFVYGRAIDGVGQLYMDMDGALAGDEGFLATQEYIRVCADTEGVRHVTFNGVYEVQEITSENVLLMDIEKIDELARAEMVENINKYTEKSATVSEVTFGYLTITYDGMHYSFVPVWMYYYTTENSSSNEKLALFAVNALDGEIIELPRSKTWTDWF